ncbi:SDR family oxidoreductase (plasmid) [Skermanella mucosa]|uniref:SDR family NAD(P)-dependent oxidoreductase n=1 Tax=Skermanella mucosa TaxID=1789672 RepID=UPI00192B87B2|nr:SDR family oxidoreductase [Skermanella mucosa]UEM24560.1 SDR family oxidoreductase [Skermanella mucosa]
MTFINSSPLAGKAAVVIGASGGIGTATSRRFAEAGAHVVATYHSNAAKADALIADLPGRGHRAFQADVEDSASLNRLAAAVHETFGRVDILVNTAGLTRAVPHADLEALDDALIDRVFAANWRGPFAAIRAFAPLLTESGDGLVVNISSIAATTGIGSNVAYCAAKAGLDIMSVSLGRALAPEVRVVSVSPGVVDTDFVPGRDRDWSERQARATPLKRLTAPDDVASAVLAAATHLRFTTGSVIVVDGGRHL